MNRADPISDVVMREAMDWLVHLRAPEAGDEDRDRWQQWHDAAVEHARAWQRAAALRSALDQRFGVIPAGLVGASLKPQSAGHRRRAMLGLGVLLLSALAAYPLSQRWPDAEQPVQILRTAVGEQQAYTLADGTQLQLNTASELRVNYSRGQRRLELLAGEVAIATGADAAHARPRPLRVTLSPGEARPMGTRFTVRLHDADHAEVTVLEGVVEIKAADSGARTRITAGQQAWLAREQAGVAMPSVATAAAWTEGLLIANDQPFCDFIAELARYRPEPLRCDAALAGRAISGAYTLRDSAHTPELIAQAMGIRVYQAADGAVEFRPR